MSSLVLVKVVFALTFDRSHVASMDTIFYVTFAKHSSSHIFKINKMYSICSL